MHRVSTHAESLFLTGQYYVSGFIKVYLMLKYNKFNYKPLLYRNERNASSLDDDFDRTGKCLTVRNK